MHAHETVDHASARLYSCRMISDFQDLSDKIDQLAELTQALRRENAHLRHANSALLAENTACQNRLVEAQARVVALLEKIPAAGGDLSEAEDAQ
jgi:cell division protein ZapB